MNRTSDVMKLQKSAIGFNLAKSHPVKEVVEFARVLMRTVIRIYKQWQKSQNTNKRKKCGRKKMLITRSLQALVKKNQFV